MLNLNAFSKPYSNLRPKTFFAERKRMITQDIIVGNGGKSYNPNWKSGKTTSEVEYSQEKRISYDSWSLYYLALMISIFSVI